jgi:uncharacterized membrane protein
MNHFLNEQLLRNFVGLLVRLIEVAGAVIIFSGAVVSFFRFLKVALVKRTASALVPVRLDLGRLLALGLEFQLASDILRSAVAPSFDEIGKLAAIATIRTALNFFLSREIKIEGAEIQRIAEGSAAQDPGPPSR